MADKILQTRIKLKYDTLTNWESEAGKNLVLLTGEIGIVEVPSQTLPDGTIPAPQILFKVGNGLTPFKDLHWASGLSADVYDWAKKAKPGDAITIETIGSGNVVTNVKWNSDNEKLQIEKGTITIPGGSGKITTTNTQVVGSATLSNHTLTGTAKNINGDSTSGITVTGDASNINIAGPVHEISTTINKNAKIYSVSRNNSNKLTFTPTAISIKENSDRVISIAAAEGDLVSTKSGADSDVILGNVNSSLISLDTNTDRPVYYNMDRQKESKIALLDDIPNLSVTTNVAVETPIEDTVNVVKTVSTTGTKGHTLQEKLVQVPTKKYVDSKIAGAVQYWGIINQWTDLGKDMTSSEKPEIDVGKGDFYRFGKDLSYSYYYLDPQVVEYNNISIQEPFSIISQEIQDIIGNDSIYAIKFQINKHILTITTPDEQITLEGPVEIIPLQEGELEVFLETTGRREGIITYKAGDLFIKENDNSSKDPRHYSRIIQEDYKGTVTSVTVQGNNGLSGSGTVTSSGTITLSHADTSSQASVNNSGRTVIQDITLDGYGHVTGIGSTTLADADTWRNININGTQFKGTGTSTGPINFKNGSNTEVTTSGNDIIINHTASSGAKADNNNFVKSIHTDGFGHVISQKAARYFDLTVIRINLSAEEYSTLQSGKNVLHTFNQNDLIPNSGIRLDELPDLILREPVIRLDYNNNFLCLMSKDEIRSIPIRIFFESGNQYQALYSFNNKNQINIAQIDRKIIDCGSSSEVI